MMARMTLRALALVLVLAAPLLGASLKDYQSRLQTYLEPLLSASAQEREQALNRLAELIPPEEDVSFGHQTIRVNNRWVHESLRTYAEETDPKRRQAIYAALVDRLAALLEQVRQAEQPSNQDARRERQQLAAILSQREFQQQQTQTWMSRFRRWIRDLLGRLFNLLPEWQRGSSPFSRLLEVLIWLLAFGVLFVLVRTLLGALRRERRPTPSDQQLISGVPIGSYKSPGDLLKKAAQLAQRGDHRSAIRYLYISLLYELQDRGLLELDAATTNGEYLRRLRSAVTIYPAMVYLTRQFDHIWYGKASPSESEYRECFSKYQTVVSALAAH
ncbi:MAG: DUF4129 domain-containing protein [Acidobacteria bacterium]|nr:DUF4129 domain-containing protein [Acidobacteriota bacterium]